MLRNNDNLVYGVSGGKETEDRSFAINAAEARAYLTDDMRNTQATKYAAANGAKLRKDNEHKWAYWWMRTPDDRHTRAMVTVLKDNDLDYKGNGVGQKFDDVRNNNTGVRPVLWHSWEYVEAHLDELMR